MTDKELADKVVALGVARELRQVLMVSGAVQNDDHAFVRDYRVAGALMERCEIRTFDQGTHYDAWMAQATTVNGLDSRRAHSQDDSLARAIVSACVQALEKS